MIYKDIVLQLQFNMDGKQHQNLQLSVWKNTDSECRRRR